MYELKNTYNVVGRTKEGLLDEIRQMEDCTEFIPVASTDITICSYKEANGDTELFRKVNADTLYEVSPKGEYDLMRRTIPIKRDPSLTNPQLLDESIREAGMVIVAPIKGKKKALYVSPSGVAALAEKAGVGGTRAVEPSLFRDMYIMEGLLKKEKTLKLVIRSKDDGNGEDSKLFGVLTEKYKALSMQLIPDSIAAFEEGGAMGEGELRYWRNSQTFTEAQVEFPEAGTEMQDTYNLDFPMVPGIRISTSDTGDAAVRIQSTYRVGSGRTSVVCKEVKRNHMGSVEVSDILDAATKELFPEIGRIPARLADLMSKQIGEPDLTTEKGQDENQKNVQKAVRTGIRRLHIGKAIGQKRAKEISEQLCCEIDGSLVYTEYDIAMMFLGLGDRLANLPDNARKMLEKACGEAPFISYQKDGESVVLLPEEV